MPGLLESAAVIFGSGAAGGFKAWGENATDQMKKDALRARDENLARLTSARDKERDRAGAAEADRVFGKESIRADQQFDRKIRQDEITHARRKGESDAQYDRRVAEADKKTAAAEEKAAERARVLGLKADRAYALEISKARTKFMTDYYNSVTGDGLRPITPEQKKAGEDLAAKYFPMETTGKATTGGGAQAGGAVPPPKSVLNRLLEMLFGGTGKPEVAAPATTKKGLLRSEADTGKGSVPSITLTAEDNALVGDIRRRSPNSASAAIAMIKELRQLSEKATNTSTEVARMQEIGEALKVLSGKKKFDWSKYIVTPSAGEGLPGTGRK